MDLSNEIKCINCGCIMKKYNSHFSSAGFVQFRGCPMCDLKIMLYDENLEYTMTYKWVKKKEDR